MALVPGKHNIDRHMAGAQESWFQRNYSGLLVTCGDSLILW